MPPLDAVERESILRRLAFMRTELADLAQFQGMTREEYESDRNRRRNLERLAENLVNAMLDMAKIVLAGETIPIPGTYREMVSQLGRLGLEEEALGGAPGRAGE